MDEQFGRSLEMHLDEILLAAEDCIRQVRLLSEGGKHPAARYEALLCAATLLAYKEKSGATHPPEVETR